MRMLRCLIVFVAVTTLALLAVRVLLPGVVAPATRFDEQLVRVCTIALVGCVGWAWLSATAVVVSALRSPASPSAPPAWVPAVVRRTVLAACGVAVLAGTAGPAVAAPGSSVPAGPQVAVGLPYPSRAMDGGLPPVAAVEASAAAPVLHAASEHDLVVRAGDSLWAIASRQLPPSASDRDVGKAWQRLYELNRDVIGDDPGLIHPGQHLVLPDSLGK